MRRSDAALLAMFLAFAATAHDATARTTTATDAVAAVVRASNLTHHADGTTYDVVDVLRDPDGSTHVRLDRRYHGLRVLGGDLVAHLRRDGTLREVTMAVPRAVAISTTPSVPSTGPDAELVVDVRREPARLAWQAVRRDGRNVLIDAATGTAYAESRDQHGATGTGRSFYNGTVRIETVDTGNGFVLRDPTRGGFRVLDGMHAARPAPPGVPMPDRRSLYREFTDADNTWGDGTSLDRATAAVDAHYAAATTWDYLRRVHRRHGLDGKGGTFTLIVHRGPENEAAWSDGCQCGTFGDGDGVFTDPWVTLDVVGHELAHGLNGATARLGFPTHDGEPRAVSEASSDIIGTLVEHFANNPVDRPDFAFADGVHRDGSARFMDRPERSGRPGCWSPTLAAGDPYVAMGVGTHFFYLLAAGSGKSAWGESTTCDGAPAVRGVGASVAGAIWYRALTVYMTSTTDYPRARQATLKAARDLYGSNSARYRTVAAAWRAVGVT